MVSSRPSLPLLYMFPDGARLLLSTQYCDEREFESRLYLKSPGDVTPRALGDRVIGRTCSEAQLKAYRHARSLYRAVATSITRPPYVVCCGPDGYAERPRPPRGVHRPRRGRPRTPGARI
jgi:hypothetical protein